jgi:hypothetical protein
MTNDSNHVAELARAIGDPKKVSDELRAFQKDSLALSSNSNRLIEKHSKKWIAIFDGKVRAEASSLSRLLAKGDELGIPRKGIVVRYIDRLPKTMIL